jgi:hypothetical protein
LVQIRAQTRFRDQLRESVYGIRPQVVIGRGRRRVRTAAEIRELVGIAEEQKLILIAFDDDDVLELLSSPVAVMQVMRAKFDAVVVPSYSFWEPRPPPDFMYSAKRSLHYFEALQSCGVPAIVRVGWIHPADVERIAEWVVANPVVRTVALDLQTYKAESFARQIDGLARFDELTGGGLRYLINGPTIVPKCAAVYGAVEPARVCMTNSRPVAAPGDFHAACERDREILAEARDLARAWASAGAHAERRLAGEHPERRARQDDP